jgi:hypothetical protein
MNYLNCTPSPHSNSNSLFDSDCTANLLIATAHCKNKVLTQTPLEIFLPNGANIASTRTATLDLPSFPRAAHTLPGLAHHSLLSVGQICDSGCAVTFIEKKVAVTHGAATILTGQREKEAGLSRVPLGNTNATQAAPEHAVHSAYEKNLSRTVQDTWLKSIQNWQFATWPSLTVDNVGKYLPKYYTMVKGHMNEIHQHIRSTQPAVAEKTQ